MMKNLDKSTLLTEDDVTSKFRHDELMMACIRDGDQAWAGILLMASKTLYRSGEKRVLDCLRQQRNRSTNSTSCGGGARKTLAAKGVVLKIKMKSSG
jgi:hypothetical protein